MTNKEGLVLVEEITGNNGSIGVLTLNSPKTLNSLTLEMVRTLLSQLKDWQTSDAIACVLLKGTGEKAFCAGGDVQELYASAKATPGGPCDYAETFFSEEYQLNYLIHSYSKPIVCVGHGIVMGGGLGLMAGASHRLVTHSTRIAMPEVTIGLFPDVGGTYFLNRMPDALGIFFGLTGASINATDAIRTRLANYFVAKDKLEDLMDGLETISWGKNIESNHTALGEYLMQVSVDNTAIGHELPSEIEPCLADLRDACFQTSLGEIVCALNKIVAQTPWLTKALKTMQAGSPLSKLLIFEQLRRYRYQDLKTVFESELTLATNLVRHPEFAEGVRALLIDKDKKPNWMFKHFSEVPASDMEALFTPPWDANPLSEALT